MKELCQKWKAKPIFEAPTMADPALIVPTDLRHQPGPQIYVKPALVSFSKIEPLFERRSTIGQDFLQ